MQRPDPYTWLESSAQDASIAHVRGYADGLGFCGNNCES